MLVSRTCHAVVGVNMYCKKLYPACWLAIFLLFSNKGGAEAVNSTDIILQEIKEQAIKTKSDAVLIMQGDQPLLSYFSTESEQPIELMSAYKSVVALAVGRLLFNGQLASLDEPVYRFYPEWKQGEKSKITVRHLLNHTSGLQNVNNAGEEIYPSPDVIRLALAAELSEQPGTVARYNNKAVNLLAGIIEKASGMRMDKFIITALFEPLSISRYTFYFDDAGNPHAMAGLELTASDAARFGLLIVNDGKWGDKELISKEYIEEMLAQSQPFDARMGLLWWRHSYTNADGETKLLYYADGYLGQYIVVIPEQKLVGVRQIKRTDNSNNAENAFRQFRELLAKLAVVSSR